MQVFSQDVTARQPEYDRVLASGHSLLQLAHPRAVPVLHSMLQQLEHAWVDLRGKVGEREEGGGGEGGSEGGREIRNCASWLT